MNAESDPPKPPVRKVKSIPRKDIPSSPTKDKDKGFSKESTQGPSVKERIKNAPEKDIPKPPVRRKAKPKSNKNTYKFLPGFKSQSISELQRIYELLTIRNSPELPAHGSKSKSGSSPSSDIPKPPPRSISADCLKPLPHPHKTSAPKYPEELDSPPPPVPPRTLANEVDQEVLLFIQQQLEKCNQDSDTDEHVVEAFNSFSEVQQDEYMNQLLEELQKSFTEENR